MVPLGGTGPRLKGADLVTSGNQSVQRVLCGCGHVKSLHVGKGTRCTTPDCGCARYATPGLAVNVASGTIGRVVQLGDVQGDLSV